MIALAILAGMFVMFVRETYPVEVMAIGGAAVMLVLGILPVGRGGVGPVEHRALDDRADVHGHGRAGADRGGGDGDRHGRRAMSATGRRRPSLVLFGFVAIASAFMNNTPLVVVMIPVFMQMAQTDRHGAVEAADPAELHDHAGRHDHADRHLDQPAGRWGGGEAGAGAISGCSRLRRWALR